MQRRIIAGADVVGQFVGVDSGLLEAVAPGKVWERPHQLHVWLAAVVVLGRPVHRYGAGLSGLPVVDEVWRVAHFVETVLA